MRVAIQGTHGSFSEAAARRRWPGLEILPCREAKDVVAAVREGAADAGCLPIENSLIGSVTTTYDLLEEAFGDGTLRLTHEILYPVHHTLMAVPGATLQGIKRVLSHPVALGQCRLWLSEHLPDAELVSAWDTAGSAEIVAQEGSPALAAVAARHAADAHGLVPLAERIEDDPTNQTRFLTFTRSDSADLPPASGGAVRYKTSLIVLIDHKPGMLALTLQAFGVRGVNLMALQSRPERSAPWTYRFYVDVDGTATDPRLAEALEEVEALAARVVVLGSYEAWVEGSRLSAPPPTPAHHTQKPDIPLIDLRRVPEGSRVAVRHLVFGGEQPVLIAGPCSVESEGMILETADAIARLGGDMLRGGAYKPRTSPYDFQGLGVKGLRYLADARERTGLPVVTEVLSWEEVAVVAHFADMLQIGARNMQNFTLLRAASRSGKPDPAQARRRRDDRGVADGGGIHPGGGESQRRALRARDPHLRARHPAHPGPQRGRDGPAADSPAGDRGPEPRGRPAVSRVAAQPRLAGRRGLRPAGGGAPGPGPRHERRRPEPGPADVRGPGGAGAPWREARATAVKAA